MNKVCSRSDCSEINPQPISNFSRDKDKLDGYRYSCKSCAKKDRKEFIKNNPDYDKIQYQKRTEYFTIYNHNYHKENRDTILDRQHKRYDTLDKQVINHKANEYTKARIKVDPLFKLKRNLRTRLNIALKRKNLKKTSKFNIYLGCEQTALIEYIESKFESWMTWDNYGKYTRKRKTWNIDHIIPLNSAKTEEEMYQLCHYTNLQPLLALTNLQKSDNI
jgi:hypothetical protein